MRRTRLCQHEPVITDIAAKSGDLFGVIRNEIGVVRLSPSTGREGTERIRMCGPFAKWP
jgi:hypothetical protein